MIVVGKVEDVLISLDDWMKVQGVSEEQRTPWVTRMEEFFNSEEAKHIRMKEKK